MKQLSSGQFFGKTNETIRLDGLTLTDTEYLHDRVDWHYHERPYFTFLLQGGLVEGTRRTVHHCGPGSLLFHNWQEPHYNIKPRGNSRGFHVELDPAWLQAFDLDLSSLEGDLRLEDPDVKFLFYKIHLETKLADQERELAIGSLLLQVLSLMRHEAEIHSIDRPAWVGRVRELLHDLRTERPSLMQLAQTIGVHPVHLSRAFPRYFNCTMGTYMRKLKVDHSLSLMTNSDETLTGIAHASGFSDQSHFIRCFRSVMGINPSTYREMLSN